MKQIIVLSLLLLSFSCARTTHESRSELKITLAPTFESSTASRATATAFEVGDEIGLYVLRSVENAKFTVAADGSITSSPAIYYPDPKQPVAFRAYYPYNSSVTDATKIPFSVTTDLKRSDLCYAQAEVLPSKEAQALPFKHILSRVFVNITLNSKVKSIKSVKLINTATDLTLNIETGAITLNSQSKSLSVNNSEAIVPPQTFAAGIKMLEITVETIAGATETYYYTPLSSMTLERGKSHSFSLALNDDQSVTLTASPQIAPWTALTGSGTTVDALSNLFHLHWIGPHASYAAVNKLTLTLVNPTTNLIKDVDVTPTLIAGESSSTACSYTFPLTMGSSSGFWYPYTVSRIRVYTGATLLRDATPEMLKGTSVYRSGTQTMGINMFIRVRDAATNSIDIKDWLNVDKDFASMSVNITTINCKSWTAVVEDAAGKPIDGVNIQPSTGGDGATVRLNWSPNLTAAARESRIIKFYPTGYKDASTEIVTTQQAGPSSKAVLINGVYWATGNLIADGANGCKIGAPSDFGIYFQFGSLIGWSGGKDGTGVGQGFPTITMKVAPIGHEILTKWTAKYWTNPDKQIGEFNTMVSGRDQPLIGIGDACRYYLGGTWRIPTHKELNALVSAYTGPFIAYGGARGRWLGGASTASGVFIPYADPITTSKGTWYNQYNPTLLLINSTIPSLSAYVTLVAQESAIGAHFSPNYNIMNTEYSASLRCVQTVL